MSGSEWKAEKEVFVSHLNGTSLVEAQSLLLVPPFGLLVHVLILSLTPVLFGSSGRLHRCIDFTLCLTPIACFCFLPWPWVYAGIAAVLPFCIHVQLASVAIQPAVVRSALHVGRGMLLFTTCLTILAVDFRIYPRRHAKTESYGYSIMDAGVGAFVFANGLFSPWARLLPSSEVWIGRENVSRVIKSSAVLIVLGFLRLAVVKAANYQEHVSEYGVHGNFFFVLAGLRILSGCLDPVLNAGMISPSRIAFVLVVTQESLLRLFVEDWVVSVPTNRNGLPIILQNVELGASFLGYAAIYYSGIDFGLWIRGMHRGAERRPMLLLMALSVVILDLAYGLFPPSRRMVNAGYFAWTVVANWIQYSSCVVIEQFFVASVDQIKRKHDQSAQEPVMNCSSPFLMRFSYNALVLFLLGNVLTGVVNLSCNTLAANSTQAVLIILGYAVLLGLASEFMDLGKQETKNLFVRLKSRVGRRLQLS